ncbi:hypothetical protein PVAND_011679 [Polypedilum vanderplanki]|uniref:CCDC66 domain-containing protein n=1 Tax=Polypedilum vanderplanki TaxID=319348 RepID=A0A9J6CK72_POLVA|nr:hypothetical protein PVAND_011679 [Polypedilum vanderplanki]
MIIKDHKDSINRELSLVEQKKMQWAKEREEMAKLEQYHSKLASKYERNTIRTQLITNTEIVHQNNNNFHQKNFDMRRLRSPNLPPIERYDKTMTRQGSNNSDQSSGYLSGCGGGSSSLPSNASNTIDTHSNFDYNFGQTHFDSLNNSNLQGYTNKYSLTSSLNEYASSSNNDCEHAQKPLGTPSSESSVTSQDVFSVSSFANSSTIDSSLNYQKSREGGRAKWGSYLFDSFSKNNDGRSSRNTTGPVWLEKSLSEARDSEEETMSISVHSVTSSSYLRGQNVPIDPYVLAEREAKRRKAIELQQAIKEQLEERENMKKIERERQWQQEKIEEERFAKQVDLEKQRLEKEQQAQNEKLENQRKKEESMKKALEKAALEAQMERERRRKEKALALQSSLDETISIQKIGERTEIFIEGYQKPILSSELNEITSETNDENTNDSIIKTEHQTTTPLKKSINNDVLLEEGDVNDEDGETILIGTPIKLKKKNLENFRKKITKRHQQNTDDQKTSDEESPKTIKSVDNNVNEENLTKSSVTKSISDLDGIAIVLQTMPIMPTFVPLTNEMFGFNQLNNLAILMAAQNRLSSPNVMLPIIPREISTPSSGEKLDLSQFIIPPSNPSTITLQIQQIDTNNNNNNSSNENIKSIPPTPLEQKKKLESEAIIEKSQKDSDMISSNAVQQMVSHEKFISQTILTTPPVKDTNDSVDKTSRTPTIPHDGTFTKEDTSQKQQIDSFTLTPNEEHYNNEIKILTPQKYRTTSKIDTNVRTVFTQTESFMFCEFCSYKQHSHLHHHHHGCSHSMMNESNNTTATSTNSVSQMQLEPKENTKPKEKKSQEERPKWGVRNPPIRYLKASEKDPFYGKNRKKRYLKKTTSESDRQDDSCGFKECPLLRSPLLARRCNKQQQQQNQEDFCSNLLTVKTDRFGRICLADEQNFIMNEALKRVHVNRSDYTSDTESSVFDMKQKNFLLSRKNDFQNVFVD